MAMKPWGAGAAGGAAGSNCLSSAKILCDGSDGLSFLEVLGTASLDGRLSASCRETPNRTVKRIKEMVCCPCSASGCVPTLSTWCSALGSVPLCGPLPSLSPSCPLMLVFSSSLLAETVSCFWIRCPEAFLSFHQPRWAFCSGITISRQTVTIPW